MQHSLAAVVWAGFVATILSTAFFWVAHNYGATRFNLPAQLGCLVRTGPRDPRTETAGFAIVLLAGSLPVAYAYAALLDGVFRPGAGGGVLLGVLHGVLALAALPLLGTISACARKGEVEAPGPAGLGWGRLTPLVIVAGHVVYGGVVGLTLGAF
jgi:hypothetical protein